MTKRHVNYEKTPTIGLGHVVEIDNALIAKYRIRRERERNRREERERKRRCHDWGDGSTADIISWFKRTPIVPNVASFAPDRKE